MNEQINALLKKQPLVLFDGECGFCNRSIQFFLKHEKSSGIKVQFAPLESEAGMLLKKYFEIDEKTESVILIRDHAAFVKSCAALRLTGYMKGLWPLMQIFVIIPPFIRNVVYDFIAKRRMKWFGRVETCALLKKEDQQRFTST